MAVKKATTTDDLSEPVNNDPPRQLTVEDLTEPEALAKVDKVKYVTVTSPFGKKSEVSEDIVDVLKDSGYKVSK